jgi:hypothetical protein
MGVRLVAHVGEKFRLGHRRRNRLLLRGKQLRLGLLAIGDVLGHVQEVLRPSRSVSDDRKAAICKDVAAIATDETLLILVFVAVTFEEFRVTLCTPGAIVGVYDLVPLLHAAQVFMSAVEHLVQSAVSEILRLGDVVKADPDGSVLEDRTEKQLVLLQGLLGTLALCDVFG